MHFLPIVALQRAETRLELGSAHGETIIFFSVEGRHCGMLAGFRAALFLFLLLVYAVRMTTNYFCSKRLCTPTSSQRWVPAAPVGSSKANAFRAPSPQLPRRASIASRRTRRYYAPRLPGNGYRYAGISPGPAASSPRSAGNTSSIWIVNLPLARRNPKVGNEAEAEANVA